MKNTAYNNYLVQEFDIDPEVLEIIQEARETVVQLFKGDAHLPELVRISGKPTSSSPTLFWRLRTTSRTAVR